MKKGELKMKGILNLKNINSENEYEVALKKYNGAEVKILTECGDTYEIETSDGSEYTLFKDEIKIT